MLDLLQQAKHEIENLRRENTILRAKAEVVDIFAGAIFGARRNGGECMAPDIAWMLKQEIDRQTPVPPVDEDLRSALEDANGLCRSMHAIAARNGTETEWANFRYQLDESLKRQHAVMFPNAAAKVD